MERLFQLIEIMTWIFRIGQLKIHQLKHGRNRVSCFNAAVGYIFFVFGVLTKLCVCVPKFSALASCAQSRNLFVDCRNFSCFRELLVILESARSSFLQLDYKNTKNYYYKFIIFFFWLFVCWLLFFHPPPQNCFDLHTFFPFLGVFSPIFFGCFMLFWVIFFQMLAKKFFLGTQKLSNLAFSYFSMCFLAFCDTCCVVSHVDDTMPPSILSRCGSGVCACCFDSLTGNRQIICNLSIDFQDIERKLKAREWYRTCFFAKWRGKNNNPLNCLQEVKTYPDKRPSHLSLANWPFGFVRLSRMRLCIVLNISFVVRITKMRNGKTTWTYF